VVKGRHSNASAAAASIAAAASARARSALRPPSRRCAAPGSLWSFSRRRCPQCRGRHGIAHGRVARQHRRLPDGPFPGEQRRMAAVHRRRRLRRCALVWGMRPSAGAAAKGPRTASSRAIAAPAD